MIVSFLVAAWFGVAGGIIRHVGWARALAWPFILYWFGVRAWTRI